MSRWIPNQRFLELLAAVVLLAASMLVTTGADAQDLNGAGVVIRHGDGTLVYVYIPFEEESISGMELLQRAGLPISIAPFAGLGTGICSIGGEGCPADDCYCHSYKSPATWWHYYTYADGWRLATGGPSSRTVNDGDIDGWSWTAGDPALPEVTIDEIAALNDETREPTSAAVIVTPGATPQALEIADGSDDGDSNLALFGVFAAVVVVAGGGALIYQQRREP